MMALNMAFKPKWANPPGATIQDVLDEREMSVEEFGNKIDFSATTVTDLLEGRLAITLKLARKLHTAIGGSPEFWMARDAQYRDDAAQVEAESRAWLRMLPLSDMVKFGWFGRAPKATDEAQQCLAFFGVASIPEWRKRYEPLLAAAAFRTSPTFDSQPAAVAAWLRQGERQSNLVQCSPWDVNKFEGALLKIRALTRKSDPSEFMPQLTEICAECGVAVAVVRAPNGCRASGATMFINPEKALLLLSFRYLSDDHFWFTFFHEAGHIVLHGQRELFLEGVQGSNEQLEMEANGYAERILIPTEFQNELRSIEPGLKPILRFARKIGIAPGIVVGQLQHLGIVPRSHFNVLKTRYEWL